LPAFGRECGLTFLATAGRYPHPRIAYRLSHLVVDAASGWAGLLYPSLGLEWVAMASKENSFAAALLRVWAMAATRRYQEKYRSRYFVATPRNGRSQRRKPYSIRRVSPHWA